MGANELGRAAPLASDHPAVVGAANAEHARPLNGDAAAAAARADGRGRDGLRRALPHHRAGLSTHLRRRAAAGGLPGVQQLHRRPLWRVFRPHDGGRRDPAAHARGGLGRARARAVPGPQGGADSRLRAAARPRDRGAVPRAGAARDLARLVRNRQRPRLRPVLAALHRPRLRRRLALGGDGLQRPRLDLELHVQPHGSLRRGRRGAVQVTADGRRDDALPRTTRGAARGRRRARRAALRRHHRALGEAQPAIPGAPRPDQHRHRTRAGSVQPLRAAS